MIWQLGKWHLEHLYCYFWLFSQQSNGPSKPFPQFQLSVTLHLSCSVSLSQLSPTIHFAHIYITMCSLSSTYELLLFGILFSQNRIALPSCRVSLNPESFHLLISFFPTCGCWIVALNPHTRILTVVIKHQTPCPYKIIYSHLSRFHCIILKRDCQQASSSRWLTNLIWSCIKFTFSKYLLWNWKMYRFAITVELLLILTKANKMKLKFYKSTVVTKLEFSPSFKCLTLCDHLNLACDHITKTKTKTSCESMYFLSISSVQYYTGITMCNKRWTVSYIIIC